MHFTVVTLHQIHQSMKDVFCGVNDIVAQSCDFTAPFNGSGHIRISSQLLEIYGFEPTITEERDK